MNTLILLAAFSIGANLLILALMLKLYTEIMKQWNQRREGR